jgi:hypothetical protein
MRREMFHTQEKRVERLTQPIRCTRPDAWLGYGYYFWGDLYDAIIWGRQSKKNTGEYEIYKGVVESDNILDTVFSEEGYLFFLEMINQVIADCEKKSGRRIGTNDVCRYIMKKAKWDKSLDGVMFADTPNTEIEKFNYRKRIQLVLYKLDSLMSFEFMKEGRC